MPRRAAFVALSGCHGVQADTGSIIAAQRIAVCDRGHVAEELADITIRSLQRPGRRPPPGKKDCQPDDHERNELPAGCGRLTAFEVRLLHCAPLTTRRAARSFSSHRRSVCPASEDRAPEQGEQRDTQPCTDKHPQLLDKGAVSPLPKDVQKDRCQRHGRQHGPQWPLPLHPASRCHLPPVNQ